MPRVKHHRARRALSMEAIAFLRIGVDYFDSELAGADDATLQAAWRANRDKVLAATEQHHGRSWPVRPAAWWWFDQGTAAPDAVKPPWFEPARLLELGELRADELARLETLVGDDLKCRRARKGMDPEHWITELETLLERVKAERAKQCRE